MSFKSCHTSWQQKQFLQEQFGVTHVGNPSFRDIPLSMGNVTCRQLRGSNWTSSTILSPTISQRRRRKEITICTHSYLWNSLAFHRPDPHKAAMQIDWWNGILNWLTTFAKTGDLSNSVTFILRGCLSVYVSPYLENKVLESKEWIKEKKSPESWMVRVSTCLVQISYQLLIILDLSHLKLFLDNKYGLYSHFERVFTYVSFRDVFTGLNRMFDLLTMLIGLFYFSC